MKFASICVAGTFDGLHRGHEALLERAFTEGERVLIGITSDMYVSQYKPRKLLKIPKSLMLRKQYLKEWLSRHGYVHRATIVSIDDPFEPAASDPSLDALIVSDESIGNGEELNRRRVARGLAPLVLHVVSLIPAEDLEPISSTRIRAGEIDRTGKLIMPVAMRSELTRPLGQVLTDAEIYQSFVRNQHAMIISVGDLTTKILLEAGITPRLMIIDNKVGREAFTDLAPMIQKRRFRIQTVASGPGFISREANRLIQTFPTGVIEVQGEEDLLVLPAVLAAPYGSIGYYGQPDKGVVEVVVTEEKKNEVRRILSGFIVS